MVVIAVYAAMTIPVQRTAALLPASTSTSTSSTWVFTPYPAKARVLVA
jgi:hypothetical protein